MKKLLLLIGCMLCSGSLLAGPKDEKPEDTNSGEKEKPAASKEEAKKEAESLKEVEGSVKIGKEEISYRARTGTLPLLKDDGKKTKAEVFFIAYERLNAGPAADRPITFAFNGGPGSSSVWLHLGAFGPYRVQLEAEGEIPPPPHRLIPNEYSLLDATDMVFVDPVSTGYSRASEGENAKQFHAVQSDIESVAEFIRLYLTRYERWNSPKYLAGESYGTTRAAGLAAHLQGRHGIELNGLMLVSTVLDFQTLRFDEGNIMPYLHFFPSYTATAWYHKKLSDERQARPLGENLRDAESFVSQQYLPALYAGSQLTEADQERVAGAYADLTGLRKSYVILNRLRIPMDRFAKELLRDQGKTVGRMDSRYLGRNVDDGGEGMEFDPSLSGWMGPFTSTFNDYVRRELQYKVDLPYEILSRSVHPWSYDGFENQYLHMGPRLRQTMVRNPSLKVFVASGYYDLATPYLATDYTFQHLGLPEDLQSNVITRYYPAGHMMYVREASLASMKEDMADFIRLASPAPVAPAPSGHSDQ